MDDQARPPLPLNERPATSEEAVRNRIARALQRARLALVWETLWPRLVPPLMVAGIFLATSWFGLWIGMPEWLRVTLLVLFGVAALVSLIPLARMRRPDMSSALARVERATGSAHRPTTGVLDRLGAQQDDPATQALWEAHRRRLLSGFGRLRAGIPSPGVPRRDPYALRFLVILIAVVGLIAAGAGVFDRLGDAFRGGTTAPVQVVDARIDAWAAPPDYTGRPPIFLTGSSIRIADAPIAVPEGTEVIVRISDRNSGLEVLRSEAGGPLEAVAAVEGEGPGPLEYRVILSTAGVVAVRQGAAEAQRWTFEVIPDEPPVIAFIGEPEITEAGALRLVYAIHDDYGVVAARGETLLVTPLDPAAIPLVGPPELALTLPGAGARDGQAVSIKDVAIHPWAGLTVQLTLVAEDAKGQTGRSETRLLTLPARTFTNPLAIALVDERRNLALDARQATRVASALDLLTLAPEFFIRDAGAYLALRSAYHRLLGARNDEVLRAMVDYLWDIAVGLEADVIADAATAAQAALDALREALEQNAPQEEIARLTEELRQAMQDYLAALAQNGPIPEGMDQQTPEILEDDQLERMLDAVEEMAAAGNRDGAQQLLDQLQQLMQNMQAGNVNDLQAQQQQQQQTQAGTEALQELGAVIEQQQQLRDETFALQQQQNEPMPTPRTDEEARQLLEQLRAQREEQRAQAGDLQRRQEELQAQLQELINNLDALGAAADTGLEDARVHMGAAVDELAEADAATAVIEQGAALEDLRGGAEAMVQRLLERRSLTVQRTQTGAGGQDPLGRPLPTEGPDFGNDVRVPDEIDRQRARVILEIIRQKLEEPGRPPLELEYLQRLLNAL